MEGVPGRASGSRREPQERDLTPALPGKPWKQLNTQKARAGGRSGAQRGAQREGADYLQAAGWQCPLLAALARQRDNGTEQSRGERGTPMQGLHHHPGGRGPRLVGSGRSGHGSDPHPGTPVPLQVMSQLPKCSGRCLNIKRS